jgi:hypothetical protein
MRPGGPGRYAVAREALMKAMIIGMAAIVLSGPANAGDGQAPPLRFKAIHVPVIRSGRALRSESLLLTEVSIKEIERATPARVVASFDQADLVLDMTMEPSRSPNPDRDRLAGPAARAIAIKVIAPKAVTRADALLVRELLTKAIERETPHRVVERDSRGDLVLSVRLTPAPLVED